MKAFHWSNEFFLMSHLCFFLLFVRNQPFFITAAWRIHRLQWSIYSLCNCPSVLVRAARPERAVVVCTTTDSSQLGFTQGWTGKVDDYPVEKLGFRHVLQHVEHPDNALFEYCSHTSRPSPLIPATLDRVVHNKSITHSFKMKIKRASD